MTKLITMDIYCNEIYIEELESGTPIFRIIDIEDLDFVDVKGTSHFNLGIATTGAKYYSVDFRLNDNDPIIIQDKESCITILSKDLRNILLKNQVKIGLNSLTLKDIQRYIENDELLEEGE